MSSKYTFFLIMVFLVIVQWNMRNSDVSRRVCVRVVYGTFSNSASRPGSFSSGERAPGTQWKRGCVAPEYI
jgi:hypothetical protein